MQEISLWLPILFFFVALFYSMVGFGGGSSYLAILVLAGVAYQNIPSTALVCNLIVTAGGCWHFYQAGHFKLKNVLPFIALSIPMAYFGGRIPIEKTLFIWLLGISLAVAAFRLLLSQKATQPRISLTWQQAWFIALPVGALLGLFSGLVGIGGGIYLAPLLLLLGWCDSKQAAAAASLFIFVNSLAGLMGQFAKAPITWEIYAVLPLVIAVWGGGQIGSRLGSQKFPQLTLQRVTGSLIMVVAARLIWRVL